jgi:hypothetical protein
MLWNTLVDMRVEVPGRFQQNIDELMLKVNTAKHITVSKFYANRVSIIWNSLPFVIQNIDLTWDITHILRGN